MRFFTFVATTLAAVAMASPVPDSQGTIGSIPPKESFGLSGSLWWLTMIIQAVIQHTVVADREAGMVTRNPSALPVLPPTPNAARLMLAVSWI